MKRSKALKLSLMGASALTLVACDNSQEVGVFETIDQCVDKAGFTRDACEANQKVAQSEHIRVSPKYTSLSDCETDFGSEKCEVAPQRTTSGGSVFMPMMMGYMMGNMLSGGSRVATQPLYRSRDDSRNFRPGDNQKVSGKTGVTRVAGHTTRAPSTKTRTIRRGGFGSAARASAGRFRSFRGFGG